jgi:creatinine amidohydrolase
MLRANENPAVYRAAENLMNRIILVVLALAITSLPAIPQTKASDREMLGDLAKAGKARQLVRYPTTLEMTFPEFEAAVAKTDVALLPIGSIEEHGPNLPLATDALLAVAELVDVQHRLRDAGVEALVGPPLNIGITNEAGDWTRDGTYMYPGSLTIGADTFVSLYLDLLRSLRDNGLRRVFLVSGHLGGRHLQAVSRIAEEANRKLDGMKVYVIIDRERLERLGLRPSATLIPIEHGFPMLVELLGRGKEMPASTHADGWEVSLMLHYYPDMVRPGYRKLPEAPSSRFFEAVASGDRTKNPGGMGGLPFDKASASVGKTIAENRTQQISEAIKQALSDER